MTLGRQKPYLSFVADALWGTHDRSRSLIMPLGATCYYDASKKQETPSGVLMVVGLVAPEKRWARFDRKWGKRVLRKFEVPHVDWATFESGNRPYKSWDREKRRAFRRAAMTTIDAHVNKIFTAGVVLEDYRRVDAEYRLTESFGSGHPKAGAYTACALLCLNDADAWMQRRFPGSRLMHLVEKGDTGQGAMMEAINVLNLGGQVLLVKKRDPITEERVRPFEAVDVIAWEARKVWETYLQTGDVPTRESTWRLVMMPGDVSALDEPKLRELCERVGIERRK